jgi:hypothetical protein
VLAADCGSIQDGFVLAADISASGSFTTIGGIPVPSPAFLAAIQDLQNGAADARIREILTYSLASNAGGACVLAGTDIEKALQACLLARLVFEWRIGIPGIGILQALFLTVRLEPIGDAQGNFDLELRLAGKPELLACEAGMPGLW